MNPCSGKQRSDAPSIRACGDPVRVAEARGRSMAERLELALSWNAVAAELAAGMRIERQKRSDP